jgi:type I restriction enzyme S subunit
MSKDKHIPQGYKDSSLGIIPKEWEVKRLGDIAEIGSGGTPSKNNNEYWNGSIPWITTSLINKPYIDRAEEYITEEGLKNSSAKLLNAGVLLMAMYGQGQTRGKVSKLLINASTNQACAYIKVHTGLVDYIHQYLIANYENVRKDSNDGNQKNLSLTIIKNIRVLCPPIEEQDVLNKVLLLWDTAIEKQSELIEKLTLRKYALMQKLLTGKKRLPGFCAKWTKMKLGDIAEIVGGGTPNTNEPQYWDGDILWFTPSEIGKTKYVSKSERTISKEGLANSSAKKLPIGTILFTSRATIGAKAILEKEATTNQGFQSIIVSNGNSNEFLYYYIDILLNTIKQKASGSTFPEVSANSLRNLTIKMPEIEEQVQIASILIDSDKEIELANAKLAKLKSQKRGLMQQLLTGKKRILN